MDRNIRGIGLLALVALVGLSSAQAQNFRANEILVKYRDGISRDAVSAESIYKSAGVIRVSRFKGMMRGMEKLVISPSVDLQDTLSRLSAAPEIEYVQPNYLLHAIEGIREANAIRRTHARAPQGTFPCLLPGYNFPPGCVDEALPPPVSGRPGLTPRPPEVSPALPDPRLAQAYGLAKTKADQAWNISKGDSQFIVAVIDTGIDYNHEDLSYNVWRNPRPGVKQDVVGYDFVHNDGLPFDDNMHGSHCAGVIGATGGNGKGISGINQRVSLMALKFLDGDGSGDTAGAIQSIEYAVSHGAKILSNSWGGGSEDDNRGLKEAIERAESRNVLFVAAAGNERNNNDVRGALPASYVVPNIISVAATDSEDKIARFSNYGARTVHLAAPGVQVYSTVPGNQYERLSGTSMACPHVAGAAALLWANNPAMTYADVKARLLRTVDKVDALDGKVITAGRLNVLRAITNQ